jgi:hypothetical protein
MKVRRCRQDDLQALKAIFAKVYPRNSLLQDDFFLDWQFHSHPWNVDQHYTIFLLVNNSDAIRGFFGYVVTRYIIDEKSFGGCEPVLWWTASENSFYGLALFEAVTNEKPVQVFLDCSKQSLALFNKMKIPSIEIPRLIGIIDSEGVHNLFPDVELKYLEDCQQKMLDAVGNINSSNASKSDNFDGTDASALINNPKIRFHLDYSPDYLKWRYQSMPLHIYQIIRAGKDDFMVYRSEPVLNSDVTVIRIVEWCVQPNNLKAVLAELISNAYKEKAILFDFFCTSREITSQLSKYGGFGFQKNAGMSQVSRWFRPVNAAPPMVIAAKITDVSGNAFSDFSSMYLTTGNSDADRMK